MTRRSALLRLARPHQWSKNLLLLAPLIFSRHLFIFRDAAIASAGSVAFCALASFAYVLNDIYDRDADRLNPEKRNRPIAAGELSVGRAARFAMMLAALGIAISLVIGRAFLLIALLYLLLQFAYSLWAKKIVILNVIAVSAGFVIRAYAGGVAINVDVSPWLVFITFSLAMFLAFGAPAARTRDSRRRRRGASGRARALQCSAHRSDAGDRRGNDAGRLHDLHRVIRDRIEIRRRAIIISRC